MGKIRAQLECCVFYHRSAVCSSGMNLRLWAHFTKKLITECEKSASSLTSVELHTV